MTSPETTSSRGRARWAGMLGGPLLAALVYLVLPTSYGDGAGQAVELSHAARVTAATGVWMAVWWITEAIPVYATALLPLALLPLAGAVAVKAAAAPYAHELIFLFMGGFLLGLAMERWRLHQRLAFFALSLVGERPRGIVGGFMALTALLSMWVSNTATTIMMLPIALSVLGLLGREDSPELADGDRRNLGLSLLLGIAYAASIGGIGTLIGTPPNLILASFARDQLGIEVSFVRWLGVGLPVVMVMLPLTWVLLTRVLFPVRVPRISGSTALTRDAYRALGPLARGERITALVFALTALAWITRPLLVDLDIAGRRPLAGLTDPGIAMLAAVALFVIPVRPREREFVMDWETATRLPWGVLLLFGGGLSLASAISATGVSGFLGAQVGGLAGVPPVLLIAAVAALCIFLTELTSNTATTATLLPILASLAPALGIEPLLLIAPAAVAASAAFMLPAATPPNAIVFGSGLIPIGQMCRAGIWLNLIGVAVITALGYSLVLPALR